VVLVSESVNNGWIRDRVSGMFNKEFFSKYISENYAFYFLVLISVLISTLHFNWFYYSHDTPKWFIFDVGITLYVAYSLRKFREIQYSYIGIIVLALLYLMLISLWWAPHKVAGIEFIFRFMNSTLLVYCLLKNYSKERLTDLVLTVLFLSALCFSLLFVFERYILGSDFNVGTFSPIGFINNTSAVFNVWIPGLVIYAVKHRKQKTRLILSICTLLIVVSVLMEAGTRGAIIGLTLSELLIFLMVLRKNAKQAVLFLTITALLLLGIGIYNVSDSLQNGRLDAKLNVMKNSIGKAGETRINMLVNTWNMTVDNPFGVGVNNFEYIHPKYAQVGQTGASPFINENQILRTPHNILVKVFSELGYAGGVLFFLLLTYCFLMAVINAFKGDYIDKWLFVGVSATLFHTMVSAVLLTPVSLFFFSLFMATIVSRSELQFVNKGLFSLRLPAAVRLLYLSIIVLACMSALSEFYAFKGRINFNSQHLDKALQFNPQNDRALLNLSQYNYYRNKELAASLVNIDQFLSLYPYHIAGLMMKAERHYQLGELEYSKDTLEKLLGIHPKYKKAKRLEQLVSIKIKQQKR